MTTQRHKDAVVDAKFNTMDSALCKAFNDADDLADLMDDICIRQDLRKLRRRIELAMLHGVRLKNEWRGQ